MDGGGWNAIPFPEFSHQALERVWRGNENSFLPNEPSKWTEPHAPPSPLAGQPDVGCCQHGQLFSFVIF